MPNNVSADKLALTFIDYSAEKSTVSFGVVQHADNATYATARDALTSAIDTVTNGRYSARTESLTTRFSNSPSVDASSARELKLLIRYEDVATHNQFVVTIPTFDPSTVTMIQNTDQIDMADGANGQTLKDAFQAIAQSPDGNGVIVNEMRLVGRNI